MGRQSIQDAGFDLGDPAEKGLLTGRALEFVEACLQARLNMAISGPAGSGKRALLYSLASDLDLDGQILVVQSPDEPSLECRGITSLRARLPDQDGSPGITRSYLLTLVPKMHPTGLILDRVDGAEVAPLLPLLLAMDGIVFSIIADSPLNALLKLEALADAHGAQGQRSVTRRILSAGLHLILQLDLPSGGSARAISLTEILGPDQEQYSLRDIFACEDSQVGSSGPQPDREGLRPTGVKPSFLHRMETLGVELGDHLFSQA
jgi:pilus assembly protein CpaF